MSKESFEFWWKPFRKFINDEKKNKTPSILKALALSLQIPVSQLDPLKEGLQ